MLKKENQMLVKKKRSAMKSEEHIKELEREMEMLKYRIREEKHEVHIFNQKSMYHFIQSWPAMIKRKKL